MNPPKLLARVRAATRTRHLGPRTEKAYVGWIRRYILFYGKRHPGDMGAEEIREVLSDLATRGRVSASTQNEARSALLFLYRVVLEVELEPRGEIVRARRPGHLPVVLTPSEVIRVLTNLTGPHHLVGSLLYGAGLRPMEAVRLRVKDVDFEKGEFVVRDPKDGRDRMAVQPSAVTPAAKREALALLGLLPEVRENGWKTTPKISRRGSHPSTGILAKPRTAG